MPIQNLVGWSVTGLAYMGISRLLWGSEIAPLSSTDIRFPFAVYTANVLFAMVLSLGTGLWAPVILAIVAGLVPASLALRDRAPGTLEPSGSGRWRPSPTH
jgi:putative membrane protein